jgi:hypothetical protein
MSMTTQVIAALIASVALSGICIAAMAAMNASAHRRKVEHIALGPSMHEVMLKTYEALDEAQRCNQREMDYTRMQLQEYQTRLDARANHPVDYTPQEKLQLQQWAAEYAGTRSVDHGFIQAGTAGPADQKPGDTFSGIEITIPLKAGDRLLTSEPLTDYNSRIA